MWKKEEVNTVPPSPPGPEDRVPRLEIPPAPRGGGERASIGRSITIRGEVSGEEDLVIQGRVDGSVTLPQQSVVVGPEGRVKAGITGRVVTVEGEVEGDLTAQEQVVLRSSARVRGDITAPRVVLEDGASFRGLVDMEVPREGDKAERGAPAGGKAVPGNASHRGGEGAPGSAGAGEGKGVEAQVDSPGPAGRGKDASSGAGKALS